MAGASNIEWTDATWNPIVGCSIVSPGCTNCYAMKMAARLDAIGENANYAQEGIAAYRGLTKKVNGNAVWTGKISQAAEHILTQPLRWKKPRKIFVNSMGDLFHESIPDEWIDRVFAVMALCPQHPFQVLTKRADRMRRYFDAGYSKTGTPKRAMAVEDAMDEFTAGKIGGGPDMPVWPLPNVWLGVSTERQIEYDERKDHLRNTPAAVRFFSMEPLLGGIEADYLGDWIIVGGESGPNARPMHPDWARSLRDQCAVAGVPFFFKQWGEHRCVAEIGLSGIEWRKSVTINEPYAVEMIRVGKKSAGRKLDGKEHNGFPEAKEVAFA